MNRREHQILELPSDLTIEELKVKHPSIPRNKYIADIFFKAGYIETWGRGIDKIINGFAKANLPEPQFREIAGGIEVTLLKNSNVPVNVPVNKQQERQQNILSLIQKNKYITMLELANEMGVTQKTIKRDIVKLKEYKVIKRIGPDKGGYWELMD